MKTSLRIFIPVVLLGSLAAGAAFAAPSIKADKTASGVVSSLSGLKDAPRLRLVLRRVIRELDLTPAQVEAARSVLKTHHAEVSAAVDAVAAARADLRATLRATPADAAALAAEADAVAAAQRELVLATALLRADLRLVLTEEQLAKLETLETRIIERIDHARGVFDRWVEAV